MLCHGQGDAGTDPFNGGCCFVNGQICPNRWYIEPHTATTVTTAIVRDNNNVSLGTVDDVARSFVGNNPSRRQRVADAVQGARYICKAAVLAIDADPTILSSRAAFEAAWRARPEYTPIGDAWVAIGQTFDWCMKFGPATGEHQCCFREDTATNTAKAGALTTTAVTIRRAAPGAS